jgi:hypothetical protein
MVLVARERFEYTFTPLQTRRNGIFREKSGDIATTSCNNLFHAMLATPISWVALPRRERRNVYASLLFSPEQRGKQIEHTMQVSKTCHNITGKIGPIAPQTRA